MRTFRTIAALKKYLHTYGVDTIVWGSGATKTIEDLFTECVSGESELFVTKKGRIVRKVGRVQLRIFYVGKRGKRFYLMERQVFANGFVRTRSKKRSASEKMLAGERPKEAAIRCLKEELGITGIEPSMLKPLSAEKKKRISSRSYPGLLEEKSGPRYKIVLPKEHVNQSGYIERQVRKTTYFTWHPV